MRIEVCGETEPVSLSIPEERASSWLPFTHSEVVNRHGRANRSVAPNRRRSVVRASEHARPTNRFLESSPYQHLRRTWHQEYRYLVQSCHPECSYRPQLAHRSMWGNRACGPQLSRRENFITDTFCHQRGSEPAWTSKKRRGAESSQIYPPG